MKKKVCLLIFICLCFFCACGGQAARSETETDGGNFFASHAAPLTQTPAAETDPIIEPAEEAEPPLDVKPSLDVEPPPVPSPENSPSPAPSPSLAPEPEINYFANIFMWNGFVDLADLEAGFIFDLVYATDDNFM
ncbi:MAG: hypothetical protein FWE82_08590, partial [Defluviitaleaceae bacterium]|nr:hypothetical protein [Defluviitaleaceae bacterium]